VDIALFVDVGKGRHRFSVLRAERWHDTYDCGSNALPDQDVHCDEYPFYATQEGGPGADLMKIVAADNTKEGTLLRGFAVRCGLTTPTASNRKGEFLVLPLPEVVDLPSMSWCNNQ
jgi:hypothetical protein